MPQNFAIYQDILNSLNYTQMIVTIFNLKGQLVGNFSKSDQTLIKSDQIDESSSETLRENLKILSIHHPKFKKPSNDNDFGYFLAGLIDNNGHFFNNQFIINLHIKNISLAYFLKSYIKYGKISRENNSLNLIISHKVGVLFIKNLINGKILTPIDSLTLDQNPSLKTWWLSGFCSNADSSFEIITHPNIKLNYKIKTKSEAINILHKEFGGNQLKELDTYYYQSINFGVAAKLCNYFRKYHQLSNSQHVNYLKWYKVYLIIQNKKFLTDEDIKKIKKIKFSMI